jgi:quinoprotein glucose dehydrogenase
MKLLAKALASHSLREQQAALAALAELKSPTAERALADWLDRLNAGQVPPGLQLDLIAAATERDTPELNTRLEQFAAARPSDDPLADYRECLEGGDAVRGRKIAVERVDLSCIRCHKVDEYGGLVGPDLSKIGGRQTRQYLLEAIVLPNRSIAKGFESVLVTTADGKVIGGVLRSEDADSLQLIQADGAPVTIAKREIEERVASTSPMPDDLVKKLSKSDLRDLVEFLASLK